MLSNIQRACRRTLGTIDKIIRRSDLQPAAQWEVFQGKPIAGAFTPNPICMGQTLANNSASVKL